MWLGRQASKSQESFSLHAHTQVFSLFVYKGARDLKSSSHASMTSTLSTKPFSMFHILKIS